MLLILALGAGVFLRFSTIGKYGFWTDELFHVFAARSFLENGSFAVPWDTEEYTRALPVTLLTALSFRLFGESEASARVAFAVVNVVFIVVAYRIIQDLFSRWVALIFGVATSLSIFSIQMSQECRMYTLFQLFYFLMSIAFFRGFEPPGDTPRRPRMRILDVLEQRAGISVQHLAWAVGLGFAAAWLQHMAINFVLVVLVYCLVVLVHQSRSRGLVSTLASKHALVPVAVAVVTTILVLAGSPLARDLLTQATEKPPWTRLSESHFEFYRRVLTDSHPLLWTIYPVGAFVAIRRYGKLGLYFVLSFLVLFLGNAFVFGRVSDRYIFQVLPFFITVGAVGVEFVLRPVTALVASAARPLARWQRALFYAAVGASVAMAAYPRIQRTVLDTSVPKFENWKGLDPEMVRAVTGMPTVTTDRLRFSYYFGQYSDYVIDSSDFAHAGSDSVIVDASDLRRALSRHPDLCVVTYDKHFFHDGFVGPDIRELILREMKRVDREDDGRIMLFRATGNP